jgi:hypothetical protein
MNFEDPIRAKEMVIAEEKCAVNQGLMPGVGSLGKRPQQPLLGRICELESALETAARALQDVYQRLNTIE